MNAKLKKALRRQSELTAKMIDGTIVDAEKTELVKLNAAITKATEPPKLTAKTTLKTMKLSEFRAWFDGVSKDDASSEELILAKRNLAAVNDQGVTDPEGIVAVEILAKIDSQETIKALEKRITVIEQKDTDGDDGDTGGDGGGDGSEKAGPVTQAIAIEGLDSVIAALSDVKAKIESGTLTHDDMTKMWPSWDVRDFIDGAVSLLAKMDEAKKVYDEILPKVKALDESGTDGDQDGDGEYLVVDFFGHCHRRFGLRNSGTQRC